MESWPDVPVGDVVIRRDEAGYGIFNYRGERVLDFPMRTAGEAERLAAENRRALARPGALGHAHRVRPVGQSLAPSHRTWPTAAGRPIQLMACAAAGTGSPGISQACGAAELKAEHD